MPEGEPGPDALGAAFLERSAHYLGEVYLPRLTRALEVLPTGDLWWRPHARALSAATVLLHLQGNLHQWVVAALGGAPDARDRAAEFSATEGDDGPTLLSRLGATVSAACVVIRGLDPATLQQPLTIQGFATTPFDALYHVVEHFAWHTGQCVQIAKQRAGAEHGLGFYDDARVNAARNG